MYTLQPKKMLILNILDILRKHSDADHTLSQQEILKLLETDYGMEAERKSIKRNLMNLIDSGYKISYSERTRTNKKGEEEVIYTDWYLEREFTDAELRLLIDGLLFSKHIPYSQCKELIRKIEGLSSNHFRSKMRHICNLPADMPENKELFYTIEILDDAIEQNRKVEFQYCDYGIDKILHSRLRSDGQPSTYLVNPYQMVATNGRYYLIGNYEKYDNISHYRLDRIRDIRICDTPAKPQNAIEGMEYGLDLPKHMAEHVYMFSGKSEHITLRTTKDMAGELIDWFGAGVRFEEGADGMVLAHVTANVHAMRYWALQYAPYVTVVSPESLANQVKEALIEALKKYESTQE